MDKGIIMFIYEEMGRNKIAFSNEFDRDMGPSSLGQSILTSLTYDDPFNDMRLTTFRSFLFEIDRTYFGGVKASKFKDEDYVDADGWDETGIFCCPSATGCTRFLFSTTDAAGDISSVIEEYELNPDYFYIKNATNNPVELVCNVDGHLNTAIIPAGEVAITHNDKLVNNIEGKEGFDSNLIDLKVKNKYIDINWEGDIYIEINPFNQQSYEKILNTDYTHSDYVGSFKEVKEKYFDYLQAKGRGEDAKSPILLKNMKDTHYKDYLKFDFGDCRNRSISNTEVSFIPDINISVNGFKSTLSTDTRFDIKVPIGDAYKKGERKGSFELANPSLDLEGINDYYHRNGYINDDFNIYIEQSRKPDVLFAEIQNKETGECLSSFEIKYEPTIDTVPYSTNIRNAIKEQQEALLGDFDIEEKKSQELKELEEGNYYDYAARNDLTISPTEFTKDEYLPFNFNPIIEVDLTAYLQFKKKDLNQTNYYKYCDPDKISFKEFKNRDLIPLSVLNKDSLNNIREQIKTSSYTYQYFKYPFNSSFTINGIQAAKIAIGEKRFEGLLDDLIESGRTGFRTYRDMTENIKRCLDQDFTVFNMKDYGNEVGGSFIYRNLEFEFDYNIQSGELNLLYFDYSVEDSETGYYKQLELPELMKNSAVQEMLIDQIDLQVNTFIAENRYGSLDEMLKAAESKATKDISSISEKSKDELEL